MRRWPHIRLFFLEAVHMEGYVLQWGATEEAIRHLTHGGGDKMQSPY